MGAFTHRDSNGAVLSTAVARVSSRDFAADALARYAPPRTPDVTIPEGDESYTEYVPVKEERGFLGRLFLGEPETKMVPVRHTSRAVERSNDRMQIEQHNAVLRRQQRDEEEANMEFVLKRGRATEDLLGIEKRIRHAQFEIELELEQQDSDRATFGLKRETDLKNAEAERLRADENVLAAEKRVAAARGTLADLLEEQEARAATTPIRRQTEKTRAETERLKAEQAFFDERAKLEKRRQTLVREEGETSKLAARYGATASTSTGAERRAPDEVEALARRATLAAVTGSVAPTTPDRYGFPFAGNIFLTHYMEKKDFDAAREQTYESMYDLYMDESKGRVRLTREKAEREHEYYETLRAEAERGGAIGALKDIAAAFTRGGGRSAFADDINR